MSKENLTILDEVKPMTILAFVALIISTCADLCIGTVQYITKGLTVYSTFSILLGMAFLCFAFGWLTRIFILPNLFSYISEDYEVIDFEKVPNFLLLQICIHQIIAIMLIVFIAVWWLVSVVNDSFIGQFIFVHKLFSSFGMAFGILDAGAIFTCLSCFTLYMTLKHN